MRILLTGGTGFLGSALVKHFCSLGHQVFLHLRPRPDRPSEALFPFLVHPNNIQTHTDFHALKNWVQEIAPQVFIHAACAYGRHDESLHELANTNILYGLKCIDALLQTRSTCRVLNIDTALPRHVNAYSQTKAAFRDLAEVAFSSTDNQMQWVNVRMQNFYGPNDHGGLFTNQVLQAFKQGHERLELTAGTQQRDFLYIDDAVAALYTLALHPEASDIPASLDIGTGDPVSIRDFASLAKQLALAQTELVFGALPSRAHEPAILSADTGPMDSLGWHAQVGLQQGILQTLQSMEKNP
jgi:CDP-paratose synthetase